MFCVLAGPIKISAFGGSNHGTCSPDSITLVNVNSESTSLSRETTGLSGGGEGREGKERKGREWRPEEGGTQRDVYPFG